MLSISKVRYSSNIYCNYEGISLHTDFPTKGLKKIKYIAENLVFLRLANQKLHLLSVHRRQLNVR